MNRSAKVTGGAAALGLLIGALVVSTVVIAVFGHQLRPIFDGVLLGIVVMVAALALVIIRTRPHNPIGWLLLGAASLFALNATATVYAALDYRSRDGRLRFGHVALTVEPVWTLGMVLFGLAVLLFPSGALPSRRWRWPLRIYLVLGLGFGLGYSLSQALLRLPNHVQVDAAGVYHGSPVGFAATVGNGAWLAAPLVVLFWAAFIARQAANWRSATGERREQLKWLISGGAVSVSGILAVVFTNGEAGYHRVFTDAGAVGIAALPIGIGVGILKYRLYEIDRLISRTLSYTILTGLLAGIFIGTVALATDVLPFSSPVGVAASTLAAAALFNPLRKRVQHLVDRRFNRARYDAETTVEAFRHRLRDAVDLESVQNGLRDAVSHAVEPAHVSVWVRASPR